VLPHSDARSKNEAIYHRAVLLNRRGVVARGKDILIPMGISTLVGALMALMALTVIDSAIMRIPEMPTSSPYPTGNTKSGSPGIDTQDFQSITERNLFRAKLQIEIPVPKTEKELEEEALAAIVKTMTLKGVMLSPQKRDNYAVIDRGGQKGVWTYEIGDAVEKGLTLREITKDSIKLEKGGFAVVLKLFSPVQERASSPPKAATGTPKEGIDGKVKSNVDIEKGIRKEGSVTIVSKSLAEWLKTNNNEFMSAIAVKAATDGLKVVAVDRGSVAQRMGIASNDTLQEVNGFQLNSSQNLSKVYEALKNSTSFNIKVVRRGKLETLRYEIR
jgi:type II secretory pathway component PulC